MLSVLSSFNSISFCSGHLFTVLEMSSGHDNLVQVSDLDGAALFLTVSDQVRELLLLVSSRTTVLFAIIVFEFDFALPDKMHLPVMFDFEIATPLHASNRTGNRAHWSFPIVMRFKPASLFGYLGRLYF